MIEQSSSARQFDSTPVPMGVVTEVLRDINVAEARARAQALGQSIGRNEHSRLCEVTAVVDASPVTVVIEFWTGGFWSSDLRKKVEAVLHLFNWQVYTVQNCVYAVPPDGYAEDDVLAFIRRTGGITE